VEGVKDLSPAGAVQKEVGQALQMFNSRLPGAGSGPALSARLTEEEVSSKTVADPPQLVRDAVKVRAKNSPPRHTAVVLHCCVQQIGGGPPAARA
jgi:hypothetical protein